jgi:phosphoserine phosphatase
MNTIILVRHGETDWNVEEIFRGGIDVELNENGVRQAQLLGSYLADVPITEIFSSPLKRATKTAEMIAFRRSINIKLAPELTDFNYGDWQGLSHKAVQEKYPKLYEQWRREPNLVKIPKGESLDDVKRRGMVLANRIIAGDVDTAVLVSHRVIHKVLTCALLGLDNTHFWNIKFDTCGITVFNYEKGEFILAGHNDTSFLRPMQGNKLNDF